MKQKFRILVVAVLLAVLFEGCWCRNCARGEEVPQSALVESSTGVYVSSDLVVNATEYKEFERVVLEVANNSLEDLSALLFTAISGVAPPTGTNTIVLTDPSDYTQWFNENNSGSFLSRSMWLETNTMLRKGRLPEKETLEKSLLFAPIYIEEATKRARFLNRISDLQNPPTDF